MAKYEYDANREVFVRKDKRGNHLAVNIAEAQRIINFMNLGYSVDGIQGKMNLVSPKGTASTVKSFIRNYKQGNIEMPNDAPVPVRLFESVEDDNRIDELEERISRIEQKMNESWKDKVKLWMRKN